eukprot:292465-Prymnesium_polylepis.1
MKGQREGTTRCEGTARRDTSRRDTLCEGTSETGGTRRRDTAGFEGTQKSRNVTKVLRVDKYMTIT